MREERTKIDMEIKMRQKKYYYREEGKNNEVLQST